MYIRRARDTDVPALVGLLEQWGHPQPADAVTEQLALWDRSPDADVLVADVDGAVVGVAAVAASPHLGRPGSSGRLMGLVVDDRQRRGGVGAALLHAAEDLARRWGCDELELTSSRSRDAAHDFYRALGYEDQSGHHARYLRTL